MYCGILFAIIEDLYIMRVNGMERMCGWKIEKKEEKERTNTQMKLIEPAEIVNERGEQSVNNNNREEGG